MSDETHKELSGSFSSPEKWSNVLCSLATPGCLIERLQVLHNKGPHNVLVAAALRSNTSVTHVEWGDLDPVGATCLSDVLQTNTHLKFIKVHRLNNVDATIAELVPGLRRTRVIEELELAWAGQECLLAAAAAVRGPASNLRRLEVSRSTIVPDVVACFVKAYALGSGALKELSIRDSTHLGDALNQLLEGLESRATVDTLQLNSCGVNPALLQALGACPNLCRGLTHLSLSSNSITSNGVQCLAKAFPDNSSLVRIDLQLTALDDRCAKDLAALVTKSPQLQTLLLAENELGDETLESLASAVSTHHHLKELDLSQNKISGIQSIGLLTCGSSPLETLKLSKNWRIGDEGTVVMAEAMMENTTMTALHLTECGVKCDGAKALAAVIKVHPALSTLHLDGCRIGDTGATALMDAVRANMNMRYWNMDNNRIRDKMTKKMIIDFCGAVSKRTDESMLKRKSLQLHHAAQQQHYHSHHTPPCTPPQNSPRDRQTTAGGRAPHGHLAPQPIAFLTPLPDKSMLAARATREQSGCDTPDLGSRGGLSTDILFPNIRNLWKGASVSTSSSDAPDDREEETLRGGMFSSFSPALRKIDSFGRWMSGSKPLTSVDSLTSWGGTMLQSARSRATSMLSVRPRSKTQDEDMEDLNEDVVMEDSQDSVRFQSGVKDSIEEPDSPRYIGTFGALTNTIRRVGSFRFFDFMRSSSESGGTPRFKSPLGSPTVSPDGNKPVSRLAGVSE